MSDAKPYPTPLSYLPETGEITHRGALVATLPGVDDFPCLDADGTDAAAFQREIDATGQALVLRYNTQPDLLAACEQARDVLAGLHDAIDAADIRLPIGEIADTLDSLDAALAAATGDQP